MITMSIQLFPSKFLLSTERSSYLIEIDKDGRPLCAHFGCLLDPLEIPSFLYRSNNPLGSALYEGEDGIKDPLERKPFEVLLPFDGTFSRPGLCLVDPLTKESFDFRFLSSEIREPKPLEDLPFPGGRGEELLLNLKDVRKEVYLTLHYYLFEGSEVLARSVSIRNEMPSPLVLSKVSSFDLSLRNEGYLLSSFHGGWANELHEERRPISLGRTNVYSDNGSSSSKSAPFFLLSKGERSEKAFAFSFLYSGSFEYSLDLDVHSLLRLSMGLSSLSMRKELSKGETFETPLALLSYSGEGRRGLSKNFHSFVKRCLLPKENASLPRPIVYNGWEALEMGFKESDIRKAMRMSKELGIELFVLDDGWFEGRNSDRCALGDWTPDKKKLPHGIEGLASYAKKLGLQFGLWMEPEMVSKESALYKAHPSWVLKEEGRLMKIGRNQYLLDLSKKEVQDFIIESVSRFLSIPNLVYLKWDYNRPFGDLPSYPSNYPFDYMKGLYHVLGEIRRRFPSAFLENCASGGNRFDHGMMRYFDMSWLSDCTDSLSRERIQKSASYLFPQCVFSNHVSSKTNKQTMRRTSLETKFDVAVFGVLGYELNLNDLSPLETATIKKQIEYYKHHREIFQFGEFLRLPPIDEPYLESFEVRGEKETMVGRFYGVSDLNDPLEGLRVDGLSDEKIYRVAARKETIPLEFFGPLVNYVSPIHLKEGGALFSAVAARKGLESESYERLASGRTLSFGSLPLPERWHGSGIDGDTRVLFDFGSRLYFVEEIETEDGEKSS